MNNLKYCSMCYFVTNQYRQYQNHVVRYHRYDPNFIAHCSHCPYSTKSWGAFKVHVSRYHHDLKETAVGGNELGDNQIPMEIDNFDPGELTPQYKQARNASFALSLECKDNITQKGLNAAISSSKLLIEEHVTIFKTNVERELLNRNLPTDFLDKIQVDSLLDDMNSSKKRNTYYKNNLGYCNPVPVKLKSVKDSFDARSLAICKSFSSKHRSNDA